MGTFIHVTALWFYWNGNRNSNRTHCLSLIIRNFLLLTVSFIEECTGCSSVPVFLVLVWRCPGFGWDTVNVLSTLQLQSEIKLLQVKDNNEFCAVKTLLFLKEVMDHIRKRPILPSQKPIKQQVKKIYPLTKKSKPNPLSSASLCGSNDQEQQHHTSSGLCLPGCPN